jgi:hypothetical protein
MQDCVLKPSLYNQRGPVTSLKRFAAISPVLIRHGRIHSKSFLALRHSPFGCLGRPSTDWRTDRKLSPAPSMQLGSAGGPESSELRRYASTGWIACTAPRNRQAVASPICLIPSWFLCQVSLRESRRFPFGTLGLCPAARAVLAQSVRRHAGAELATDNTTVHTGCQSKWTWGEC